MVTQLLTCNYCFLSFFSSSFLSTDGQLVLGVLYSDETGAYFRRQMFIPDKTLTRHDYDNTKRRLLLEGVNWITTEDTRYDIQTDSGRNWAGAMAARLFACVAI